MTSEAFFSALKVVPFTPFRMRLRDRRVLAVDHRHDIDVAGKTTIVVQLQGSRHVIELSSVVSSEFGALDSK
jgi:hypothetical protein